MHASSGRAPRAASAVANAAGSGFADPDLALDAHAVEEAREVVALELGALEPCPAVREEAEHVAAAAKLGQRLDRSRKRLDPRFPRGRERIRDLANELPVPRQAEPAEGLREDRAARREHVLARDAAPSWIRPERPAHRVDRLEQTYGRNGQRGGEAPDHLAPEPVAAGPVAQDGVVEVEEQRARQTSSHRRKPPSELSTWPVTQAASSLTSQVTSRAASSGTPTRPKGERAIRSGRCASEIQPVSVGPGFTAFTVMPCAASPSASVAVEAARAPFEAA